MPTDVGRVEVNKIIRLRFRQNLIPSGDTELPVFILHLFGHPTDLIDDLRDISLAETLWFMSEWNIELSVAIETNHAIEAGAIQKQKVERRSSFVESPPYLVIVVSAASRKFPPLLAKKLTNDPAIHFAPLNGFVEIDDV